MSRISQSFPSQSVETRLFQVECPPELRTWTHLARLIASRAGSGVPVRLIIVGADGDHLTVEASFVLSERQPLWPSLLSAPRRLARRRTGPSVVVHIIPTGVRAEIGGFAGDATPVTNLLASACDFLVCNPNTVTASDLYFAADNVQYVEGNLICRFMLGQLALQPVRRQAVGLIVEQAVAPCFLRNVQNAINAMRTVAGIRVEPVVVTEQPIRTRCTYSDLGHATGEYGELDELFAALDRVHDSGVGALGLVTSLEVPESVRQAYYGGEALPNPWGSAEAILTHLTTSYYPVTAAHSPLLQEVGHTMFGTLGDPRDGAELISSAFLCSMVQGLSQSPRIAEFDERSTLRHDHLSVADVRAVVMPESVIGNIPFFAALDHRIPIILVRGNKTIQDITPARLGLVDGDRDIHVVNSYIEASGLLLALQEGMDLAALTRPVVPLDLTMMAHERAAQSESAPEPLDDAIAHEAKAS